MIWYTIATLCLLVGVGFLVACLVLRNGAYKLSGPSASEEQKKETDEKYKKAKKYLAVGLICLVLTEAFILLGNHLVN